jgi:hypothetical protein
MIQARRAYERGDPDQSTKESWKFWSHDLIGLCDNDCREAYTYWNEHMRNEAMCVSHKGRRYDDLYWDIYLGGEGEVLVDFIDPLLQEYNKSQKEVTWRKSVRTVGLSVVWGLDVW